MKWIYRKIIEKTKKLRSFELVNVQETKKLQKLQVCLFWKYLRPPEDIEEGSSKVLLVRHVSE
jgi:hypothetical protein